MESKYNLEVEGMTENHQQEVIQLKNQITQAADDIKQAESQW